MTAPVRFCLFNTGRLTRREVWDTLKDHLTPEVLDGVIRVQTFLQPNGYPRTDFWLEARVAAGVKRGLYLTATQRRRGTKELNKFPLYNLRWLWKHDKRTSRWRLDTWKSWRDRKLEVPQVRLAIEEPPRKGFATLNINGMGAKKPGVESFLRRCKLGVLAIQETLLGKSQYRFYVWDYEVYQRPKETGFRGHALLVSRRFPSYEVSPGKSKCFIHVKITKLSGERPWHVISVYLPSGGNRRSERTDCLRQILAEYREIVSKDGEAKVVIMGDFNM
ncbi:Endonuclease/exonuclease/phosphatase, partial [Pisolithus albus]